MTIRDEAPGDEAAIRALTEAAFAPVEMSDGSEAQIVDGLRLNGDLTVSLVAVEDDQIVGHVAFSPVTVSNSDGRWFGLGPISVHPDRQRSGIGRQLIEEGLERLRSLDAVGCVLLGDPAYYGRFGFTSSGDLTYGNVPTQYVQALSFGGRDVKGEIRYSSTFGS
ncbi:putative acetyltransferase [Roseovarius pacificus]|uniref:Putative acetyltransferase n=1 Tax=Roseovarius pacificus TaxID=337701 RepID=A0A1M7DRQ3_9RHOB|nr:N-acetyltransferase [Roseovarius pacificus]GGO56975.1 GCN5 family N-acetyltransferase [Roseovarius pacificus]SHL82146.1 putative acetyltransferase [Roseovarius pacificus]